MQTIQDTTFWAYQPKPNHLDPESEIWDGCMFETYGPELDFVKQQPNRHIWTLVEADDSGWYILTGFHLVNRVGYFVTEKPWPEQMITIQLL